MLIYDEVFYVDAFSDDYVSGDDTVLYDSARFDHAASSDDGILDCALDQAAVGYDGRCHLAAFEILCRAGVVRTGVDRPVRAEQIGSVLQVDQGALSRSGPCLRDSSC